MYILVFKKCICYDVEKEVNRKAYQDPVWDSAGYGSHMSGRVLQHMKKKYEIVLMVLAILCTLIGCGRTQEAKTEEKIVLTYMAPSYGNHSFVGKEAVEKVNEAYPDIEIRPVIYSEEQYYTVLKTRLATGKGPDFFFVQPEYAGPNGVSSLAKAGYLTPVTDMEGIKNADETKCALIRDQDQVYSVSVGKMALGVLYNKTLFEENGVTEPECWEDFLKCCSILKEKGIQPMTLGGKARNTYQYGLYQIAVNQLYPRDPDYDKGLREGTKKFTDKGTWDNVLTMYTGLYREGYMDPESMELTAYEARQKLENREAAMLFVSSGEARDLVTNGASNEDEYGMMPLPANNRGEKTYWSIGETGGVGLYAGTEYPKECKRVLENEFWKELLNPSPQEDAFMEEINNAFEAGDYFYLCNQGWNNEVEIVMEKKLAEYITGSRIQIRDITRAMQEELER